MPNFEAESLFIDFARLPPPAVIEAVDYDEILQRYRGKVVELEPKLAKAVTLEQSATNVVLETQAYGDQLLRTRINAAARAVMLPFSTGTDLAVLGALLNVDRLPLVENPRDYVQFPQDWESDTRFRRRIQLASESFSTAGSEGAYVYHGLTSDVTIRDVSVMKVNDRGGLKISVMGSGSDPTPTAAQLANVTAKLLARNVKPLTDVLSIAPVRVIPVDLTAILTLYPGPDTALVMASVNAGLTALRNRLAAIGRDLTRAAILDALYQEGVQNVALASPEPSRGDVVATRDTCIFLRSATVSVAPLRLE